MPDGGGGPLPWRERLEPGLRPRVLDKIVGNLVKASEGKSIPLHELKRAASSFEQKMFKEANSKDDYLRKISHKLVSLDQKRYLIWHGASGRQQPRQMGCQMQLVSTVQAFQGRHSPYTAISHVAPMTPSHGTSSQLQNLPLTPPGYCPLSSQHMAYPPAPNMHIKVKKGQAGVCTKLNQVLNSPPASVTPLRPNIQPGQLMMQSVEIQNLNQLPSVQLKPTNFSRCNPTSIVLPWGQPIQANVQQHASGTGMVPQQQLEMNQKSWDVNQYQMDRQGYQMLLAQQTNATKMQADHPGGWNYQQGLTFGSPLATYNQEGVKESSKLEAHHLAVPQHVVTVGQQSSLLCMIPETLSPMGNAGEVDWREEMFQQIKQLKDAYLLELVELDQAVVVPPMSKKQFESLPNNKAEKYRYKASLKKRTSSMVKFLQFQKSNIPDNLRGQLPMFIKAMQDLLGFYRRCKGLKAEVNMECSSKICRKKPQIINLTGDSAPSSGGTSKQKTQQGQPVDFQLRQNVATRTPAGPQKNHSNILLGVVSSGIPLASNMIQDCCTPSPFTETCPMSVSSPSALAKSTLPASPVAKPRAVIVASPSEVMKSTFPSPVAKPGFASPSTSLKSTLPSPIATSGVIQAASPLASVKSTLPSSIAKSGEHAPSPCASVKSTSRSSPADLVALPVTSPCASVQSTSSESSISAFSPHDKAAFVAENGSKQNTPSKHMLPASPLQSQKADHRTEDQHCDGAEAWVVKKPMERLMDAVRSSSLAALHSSVNSMSSIVSMSDRVPFEEICTVQHWALFSKQGGSNIPNKMKPMFDNTTLFSESSPLGSMDSSGVAIECSSSEAESSLEHGVKRRKTQNVWNALLHEIESANRMLIDSVISIADDNKTDGISSCSGGTLIKVSYTATSLAPDLKSLFTTFRTPIVMPVKISIPADYPRSSPVLVNDTGGEQLRNLFDDISSTVKAAFQHALDGLPEPRSVREMASVWESCVQQAVVEFAQRLGGGTFSSRYGRWESSGGA